MQIVRFSTYTSVYTAVGIVYQALKARQEFCHRVSSPFAKKKTSTYILRVPRKKITVLSLIQTEAPWYIRRGPVR